MGNFDMLPFDIMLDILTRLPAESVLQCKFVSKSWRDVVQHPSFLQMHLDHSADDSGKLSFMFYSTGEVEKQFFYTEYDENLNRFTRTTRINLKPPLGDYYSILGSCNGLICFNEMAWFNGTYNYEPAYICNPITRECIFLPKYQYQGGSFLSRFSCCSLILTGFGYCPLTDEYKVVRIYYGLYAGIVEVYTLGSGLGWRNLGGAKYFVRSSEPRGVFVNGSIHWAGERGTIFAFDLTDEEFHKLPSPSRADNLHFTLHVLGDFLCAYDKLGDGWEIWFLKKNNNYRDVIWSKEFSDLKFEHMLVKLITLTKSGGLLFYCYLEENVYLYPPKGSSPIMLANFGHSFHFGKPHKNTLVSLKALGEEDTKLMDSVERARSGKETENSNH